MTKLVIFDLDGVMIDSRDAHFHALNDALRPFGTEISRDEHVSTFDGLPTKKKLEMLVDMGRVKLCDVKTIRENKQDATIDIIRKTVKKSEKLQKIFMELSNRGIKTCVASNAVIDTVRASVRALGLSKMPSFITGNNVDRAKPHPDMYWRCMTIVGSIPRDTLIIEDSHIGRQAAIDSGAHLLAVEDPEDLTFEKVMNAVDTYLTGEKKSLPWRDSSLNVLIPMAGAGSRFQAAGYTFPKPLIEVDGKPMIQMVVENLNIEANYIFIVQKEHYEKYSLQYLLNLIAPGCKIVQVDGMTEGAACTALLAKEHIDNDQPLLIANSDQWIDWNSNECMYAFKNDHIDGGILTFKATHPKWSYARIGEDGFVAEVAEKRVISTDATVGVYFWRKGSDFVRYARSMIEQDKRVNGEFYIAPVFNEAIADGAKIRVKTVDRMIGTGTPEDLEYFLKQKVL